MTDYASWTWTIFEYVATLMVWLTLTAALVALLFAA